MVDPSVTDDTLQIRALADCGQQWEFGETHLLPSLGPTLPPPNAWVLIELLCTDDKFRGRGVGKLLLVPRWICL